MNKKTKTIALVAGFAVFIAVSALLYNRLSPKVEPAAPEPAAQPEGSAEDAAKIEAPDFTVTDREGNAVTLSQLRGKPVVLNFWASWCGPCQSEMPEFDAMAKELDGKVQFMMVNLTDGYQETQEQATAYLEEMGYQFPVYFDLEQEAATVYGISSIPTTYFIDADGYAVSMARSTLSETQLRKQIQRIYS